MVIINLNDKSGKLFFIGGVVRDFLLGKESLDIDIVYEGNAIEYCKRFGEVIQVNPDFGTIRVNVGGQIVDFASTRCETYEKKGHLPVVKTIGCNLKDDVMRRDFTINAMAMSLSTGEIIDYVSGQEDLKNKKLRVLHDGSFIDDPTRIIRGLKFSVRFGFELEEHTKELQKEYLANINYDMCYKRVKKELIETFNLNSQIAFERFINQKIYKLITPNEVKLPSFNIEELVNQYRPEHIWIVYVGVIRDISRLDLTRVEGKIRNDFYNLEKQNLKTDFEIYKAFEDVPLESILLYAILKDEQKARRYLDELCHIKLEITGKDLQKMGLEPSPKYSEIFDYVLKEKLANPSLTKEDEINLVNTQLT